MPRSRLGPLAIESPLGSGTSATAKDARVWRAVHVQKRKTVALRVFTMPFGGTIESRQQFADEWETLKALQHPAIAQCYGGGFEESEAYLVHELIEGGTLADEIERRGRLPWEQILEIAEPLADALNYLHTHGVVHGRLAPDKIMMAGFSPVLIDVRGCDGMAPFRSGPFFPTRPPTMRQLMRRPPEAPGIHDAVTAQSDLYGLGAVLYEGLTGSPPVSGSNEKEVLSNLEYQSTISVASTVLDCPVWMDKLVMQLLHKEPASRCVSAAAVQLQLAEVRRRAMSRTGVAEHASSGFSPLAVTDESDKQIARSLLGKLTPDEEEATATYTGAWHDQAWFLVPVFVLLLGMLIYMAWPLSEDRLRTQAESMMADGTRSSLSQARISYLEPLLRQYPDGQHANWAREQIDHVEMVEAEHALTVKINRNLPLRNEAERLCAEAMRFEQFGDRATAVDKYRSMITLLDRGEASAVERDEISDKQNTAPEEDYGPLVNLARYRISQINLTEEDQSEAARIITSKLREADELFMKGRTIAAREIWYGIVELYGNNAAVTPLVKTAQDRLAETSAG
ncbi:MAG: serine/threonine-protein kinase [Planctomycetota bacterium]